jgi:hypothetical protein
MTPHRIAIVNGYVLSMDGTIGELEQGSVQSVSEAYSSILLNYRHRKERL